MLPVRNRAGSPDGGPNGWGARPSGEGRNRAPVRPCTAYEKIVGLKSY